MLEVKEIWTASEYNYQKELFQKFSFGGNKEEMNSWINQKKHAGKNGSCRLEVDKERPPGKAAEYHIRMCPGILTPKTAEGQEGFLKGILFRGH